MHRYSRNVLIVAEENQRQVVLYEGSAENLLATHPEVYQKVEQEVMSHLGNRSADVNALPHLPYLRQVVDETLRLDLSAWILFCRQAIRNTVIGNYKVNKGSWVFIIPFVTHRDERFFPDPLEFDPRQIFARTYR